MEKENESLCYTSETNSTFCSGSVVKNPPTKGDTGDRDSIPGQKAMAPLLQYSCLENPMDGGAWWAAVHGVARSRTRLSDFTLFFHFHVLEKEMANLSSVLAWRVPGTGEPGGLPD